MLQDVKKHDNPDLLVLPTDAVVFTDDGFRLVKAPNRHAGIMLLVRGQTRAFVAIQQPCMVAFNRSVLPDLQKRLSACCLYGWW